MTSERTWDWADRIAHRVIGYAAQRLPRSLSDRIDEEWLADLATRRRPAGRLWFAVGCHRAANVIAHECTVPAVSAMSAPAAHGHFIRFPEDDFPFVTGVAVPFFLIVSLFTSTFYGLALALGLQWHFRAPALSTRLVRPGGVCRTDFPGPLPPDSHRSHRSIPEIAAGTRFRRRC